MNQTTKLRFFEAIELFQYTESLFDGKKEPRTEIILILSSSYFKHIIEKEIPHRPKIQPVWNQIHYTSSHSERTLTTMVFFTINLGLTFCLLSYIPRVNEWRNNLEQVLFTPVALLMMLLLCLSPPSLTGTHSLQSQP